MPTGKVRWYDAERGFGFVSNPAGEDCYISKQVLPEGVDNLHPGQRVEYDFADGRPGPQVLRMTLLDPPRPPRVAQRKYKPDQLHGMISDVVTLLEATVQPDLRSGRFPDRKTGKKVAEILRAVARELEA